MAKIDFNKIPRFSQLPVKPGAPPDSNSGVFGDDDEVGCINFLTEDGIIEAAKLVRKGKVFRLDTPINYANPPLFERSAVKHTKKSFEDWGLLGYDDVLDNYNTQEAANGTASDTSATSARMLSTTASRTSRSKAVTNSVSITGRTNSLDADCCSTCIATAPAKAGRSTRSATRNTPSTN